MRDHKNMSWQMVKFSEYDYVFLSWESASSIHAFSDVLKVR